MRGTAAGLMLLAMAMTGMQAHGQDLVASYVDGEYLTASCREFLTVRRANGATSSPKDAHGTGLCYGFVVAVVETDQWREPTAPHDIELGRFCIPETLNANSITEAVARWMDEHPEQRNAIGYVLTRRALADRFPC